MGNRAQRANWNEALGMWEAVDDCAPDEIWRRGEEVMTEDLTDKGQKHPDFTPQPVVDSGHKHIPYSVYGGLPVVTPERLWSDSSYRALLAERNTYVSRIAELESYTQAAAKLIDQARAAGFLPGLPPLVTIQSDPEPLGPHLTALRGLP